MSAWVMYDRDYSNWIWTSTIHFGFQDILPLPLFDSNPNTHSSRFLIEENDLILVVDTYIHRERFTLEQIEEINKTWNKFYDQS